MSKEIIKNQQAKLALNSEKQFCAELERCNLHSIRDFNSAMIVKTPSIGELVNIYGESPLKAFISGHIVSLRDFVNLKGAMTDEQTIITSELIVQEYKNITLADIVVIFRMAKLGKFGEFYGRLDGQMILSWVGKYFEDRCNYFAEKSIYESISMSDRDRRVDPKILEIVNKIVKK